MQMTNCISKSLFTLRYLKNRRKFKNLNTMNAIMTKIIIANVIQPWADEKWCVMAVAIVEDGAWWGAKTSEYFDNVNRRVKERNCGGGEELINGSDWSYTWPWSNDESVLRMKKGEWVVDGGCDIESMNLNKSNASIGWSTETIWYWWIDKSKSSLHGLRCKFWVQKGFSPSTTAPRQLHRSARILRR